MAIDFLAHVYWIGGSACAGKTAVAQRLAAETGLFAYHCDERFGDHVRRADPERHQRFLRLARHSPEELWMRPVEELVAELRGFYREELGLVVEDLLAWPENERVLVEGAGLLPWQLADLIFDPYQAIWLVSTPDFRRRHYPSRGPEVLGLLAECSDPEEAYRRWMERDDAFAALIVEEARQVGGRVLVVDGHRTLEENVAEIARHFGL